MHNLKRKKSHYNPGFTLIELLLVVGLIGVLAGVVIRVIDVNKTKDRAKDAVRLSNMDKVMQGLEAFYTVENKYPAEGETANHDPLNSTAPDSVALSTYIKFWPGDTIDIYTYHLIDADNYVVGVKKSGSTTTTTYYYKYHSSWSNIQICTTLEPNTSCPDSTPLTD